jgi:2,3-bisphosphoglycerate-independent phosphoglycerate mutase
MDWEKLAPQLCTETSSRIVLLVMDGLGGLPIDGKTALEAAHTPHLDALAARSSCGLTDPVSSGITPGSGPAHLSLFGYNPLQYILGRGILEALGVGVEVGINDLVARGNFATIKEGLITDRRAGRIPTSENERLCSMLNAGLKSFSGASVDLFPGKEHRFVVRFRGEGLSDALTDADPQKNDEPPAPTKPIVQEAEPTAQMVNSFIKEVSFLLRNFSQANTILLRGFSKHPSLPTMEELYRLKPVAVANYPMYRGLARLVGMETVEVGPNIEDVFAAAERVYPDYTFFYLHIKQTDAAGEDGNFEAKVSAIKKTDACVPRLLALEPDVLVVTSDHSTPCLLKSHSWHPNPFLLHSRTALSDGVQFFSEKECSRGYLGRFPALSALPLMLAHAEKLKKFGA